MKKQVSWLFIAILISTLSGCAVFGGGCKCPKVSYSTYPQR